MEPKKYATLLSILILLYGVMFYSGSLFSASAHFALGDFTAPYTTARAYWMEGIRDLYPDQQLQSPPALLEVARKAGFPFSEVNAFLYHPVSILLYAPISLLSYKIVTVLIIVINSLLLALILAKVYWRAKYGLEENLIITGFLLSYFPIRHTILCGQINFLLILLLLFLLETHSDLIKGILVGTLLLLKPQFGFLLPVYYLIRGKWRIPLYTIALYSIVTGLTGVILGKQIVFSYFSTLKRLSTDGLPLDPTNQSLPAVFLHAATKLWGTRQFFVFSPFHGMVIKVTTALIGIGALVFLGMKKGDSFKELPWIVMVGLLVTPIMWLHYLSIILIVLPFFINGTIKLPKILGLAGVALTAFAPKSGYPVVWTETYGCIGFIFVITALAIIIWQDDKQNQNVTEAINKTVVAVTGFV